MTLTLTENSGLVDLQRAVLYALSTILEAAGIKIQTGPVDITVDGTDPSVGAGVVDGGTIRIVQVSSSTPTHRTVAASATSVTLLAENSARRGATITNDSTATLYLKLGATASTSSYTVQLGAADYYDLPFGYVGVVDGIWSSATGNARITELT